MSKQARTNISRDVLYLVIDAGNSATKAVVLGASPNSAGEVYFPSAVHAELPGQYESRLELYRTQPAVFNDTIVFSTASQPAHVGGYIVGAQAEQIGRFSNVSGIEKYRVGYMDILLLAALLRAAPDGHDSVFVAAAYPSGAAAHIDMIKRCLTHTKTHRVKRADGEEVEYHLVGFSAWEEPSGGIFRFFTHPNRLVDIEVGDKILFVDIGGRISSMTLVRVSSGERFEILSAQTRSFQVGVNDVKLALEKELIRTDPSVFRAVTVPPDILEHALRFGGMVRVRGEVRNYSTAVMSAAAQLIRQLSAVFYTDFAGGLDIDHIVCSGGGSGLLFELLRTEVFSEHVSVSLADDPASIQFANARGAAHSLSLYLASRTRAQTVAR